MSLRAELSSTVSTLEEVTLRVGNAADSLVGSDDEDLTLGLMEVERSLRTAQRRLGRMVKEMEQRASR